METTTPDTLFKLATEAIAFNIITDIYPNNILDFVKIPEKCMKEIKKYVELDEETLNIAADMIVSHREKNANSEWHTRRYRAW